MISFPKSNPHLFKILNDNSVLHFSVCNECNESICTQKLHQDDFRILPNALSMAQMLIVLSLLVLDSDLWPVKMIRGRHPSHLRYHSIGLHYTLVYTAKIPSGDNLLALTFYLFSYLHTLLCGS